MHNILRFLIGLGVFFLALVAVVLIFVIFSPLIAAGSLLFVILLVVVVVLFSIAAFLGFIWYLSRKEPNLEKDNNDYSIDQGKEV